MNGVGLSKVLAASAGGKGSGWLTAASIAGNGLSSAGKQNNGDINENMDIMGNPLYSGALEQLNSAQADLDNNANTSAGIKSTAMTAANAIPVYGQLASLAGSATDMATNMVGGVDSTAGGVVDGLNPFSSIGNIGAAAADGDMLDMAMNIPGIASVASLTNYQSKGEKKAESAQENIDNLRDASELLQGRESAFDNTQKYQDKTNNTLNSMYGVNTRGSESGGFNQYAEGGDYISEMPGNDVIVDNGGTHEQNPNGGVQVGYSAGKPALLEEGEVKTKVGDGDYVFSSRLY